MVGVTSVLTSVGVAVVMLCVGVDVTVDVAVAASVGVTVDVAVAVGSGVDVADGVINGEIKAAGCSIVGEGGRSVAVVDNNVSALNLSRLNIANPIKTIAPIRPTPTNQLDTR